MKLPISKRLLACADFVPQNARAADIGTDHGYLAIYLCREKIADSVIACDLREGPLQNAKANAERFAVADRIVFRLADGLSEIAPDEVDTVVCAGMGGDLILRIVRNAPWLKNEKYTLILQPQSAVAPLRDWLCKEGFEIRQEQLVEENGFYYPVLRLVFGKARLLSPGEQFLSPQLQNSKSELLAAYAERIENQLSITVQGLQSAEKQRPEKLAYYMQALSEIQQMRKKL